MANERIRMRKIKETLRLRFGLGLSQRQTAQSINIGRSTVQEYEDRFKAAHLVWPLPETMDDAALEALLFRKEHKENSRPAIPFEYLVKEMKRPNVTLSLLWEEYKQGHPDGYQYSQFSKRYHDFQKTLSYSMRQDHKGGEKLFVDFGEGLSIRDPRTRNPIPTKLFVAVWGASSYLFARATSGEDMRSWIEAHVKCFEFCGCAPHAATPDNLKAAVTKSCRYDPVINPIYSDLAAHYGFCVLPARPRHPKDKAKVENGVLLAKRWILARLRNHIFESLAALNEAIEELVVKFNERPLRRLGVSRTALFEELDKPNALALPEHAFEFADWKSSRVGINYHVEFDENFYSVPYTLIHQILDIRGTATLVQIFKCGQRILTHPRSFQEHDAYVTRREHMPPSHQKYLEWTPDRIVEWADKYGAHVKTLIEKIMASRVFPEQAYRSCLGIIRLGKHLEPGRLDNACKRALSYSALSYTSIKKILENGLDLQTESGTAKAPIHHDNLRGPEYYNRG